MPNTVILANSSWQGRPWPLDMNIPTVILPNDPDIKLPSKHFIPIDEGVGQHSSEKLLFARDDDNFRNSQLIDILRIRDCGTFGL